MQLLKFQEREKDVMKTIAIVPGKEGEQFNGWPVLVITLRDEIKR